MFTKEDESVVFEALMTYRMKLEERRAVEKKPKLVDWFDAEIDRVIALREKFLSW